MQSDVMIAPQLHFLADIADQMEQINHHDDDEHDQSSNEENTHDDQQQLLFKYLAESLQKQQQQQQTGPIDFSTTSNTMKKEILDDDEEEEEDLEMQEKQTSSLIRSSIPILPPLLLRNKHGKPTRPFKAYPRDPLSLPLGFYSPLVPSSDNLLNVLASSNDDFSKQFRKRIQQAQERVVNRLQDSPIKTLNQYQEKIHSPSSTTNNIPPKKRYRPNTPPPEISSSISSQQINQETDTKDDAYWERRRKNNEAAKRSRDARRAKEDEIALRAAWLEQENLKLRLENAHLKQENVQLRCQIYGSTDSST
ncbi:unnamed protein product [Rotaria sordida]|uniref:BZIP domain-containing protein n=2 Tax=Rotaria sordida TaxID=392033 RepID=A0A815X1A4_9BILA|nr:unnamed protein product [Rotaria sordida]